MSMSNPNESDEEASCYVIAAGRGSRLIEATRDAPKCMVTVNGVALIDTLLAAWAQVSPSRPTIVGGYQIETLRRATHGMLASYLNFADAIGRTGGLVCYSDVATSADNLRHLLRHTGDIVIANNTAWESLWRHRFDNPLDDAESFVSHSGRLVEIGKRVSDYASIQGQFMGLIKFSSRGWKLFESFLRDPSCDLARGDTTSLLNRMLADGVAIDVVDCTGQWMEIDTPRDRMVAERIQRERIQPHVWD
jgi:L-glutamine-phosphate cytidylyltransferase